MTPTLTAAEYRRLVGATPADAQVEMDAESYRRLIGGTGADGLLPQRNLDSSQVDTESPAKVEFAEWLDLASPYPVLREHRFLAPERQFRADWAIEELKLILEFDGVVHHTTLRGAWRDAEKGNLAQLHGWMFLRVNSASIRDGSAYEVVERAIFERMKGVAA